MINFISSSDDQLSGKEVATSGQTGVDDPASGPDSKLDITSLAAPGTSLFRKLLDFRKLGASDDELRQAVELPLEEIRRLIGNRAERRKQEEEAKWVRIQALLRDKVISARSPDLTKQLVEKGFDPSFVRKVTKQMSVAAGVTGGNAADSGKESVADRLVELALARFRIGRSETDEAFAVERGGPNIAIMFRGSRLFAVQEARCTAKSMAGFPTQTPWPMQ